MPDSARAAPPLLAMHASERKGSTHKRSVERVALEENGVVRRRRRDVLATEEPLEIRVQHADGRVLPVSVTMRTPGSDFELAAGFLYGEGLLDERAAVSSIRYCVDPSRTGAQQYNVVTVDLAPGYERELGSAERNFYTTSSCGVCGKASIDAVLGPACQRVASELAVTPELLLSLPPRLREAQAVFDRTGGLHAAALFTPDGTLVRLREDVGRHNAMDKLVGASLLAGELPLDDRLVLVSGRLSFELVQKAVRAGAGLLAGVSAPSSLAVELAEQAGLTLVGFLRHSTFNIYAGAGRVVSRATPQPEPGAVTR